MRKKTPRKILKHYLIMPETILGINKNSCDFSCGHPTQKYIYLAEIGTVKAVLLERISLAEDLAILANPHLGTGGGCTSNEALF
jgi:hypothetical protein